MISVVFLYFAWKVCLLSNDPCWSVSLTHSLIDATDRHRRLVGRSGDTVRERVRPAVAPARQQPLLRRHGGGHDESGPVCPGNESARQQLPVLGAVMRAEGHLKAVNQLAWYMILIPHYRRPCSVCLILSTLHSVYMVGIWSPSFVPSPIKIG